MKDMDKGVSIIKDKIQSGSKIRVVGDYDVDGVVSTYILYKSMLRCGAKVDYDIPHRIQDGYGINNSIIEKAKNDGINTIITCDNGISAIEQIDYAKQQGLTVIITDHHDVPFVEDETGKRSYLLPSADAIIDSKQADCQYPFKLLCGAAVAFKFIQTLFEEMKVPDNEIAEFYEMVAIATVCDVVDLMGENRIFVKRGLEMIGSSSNLGLCALLKQTGIKDKAIGVYHLGFILGPCINACGRLDYAEKGLKLLLASCNEDAERLAEELHELNNERKNMTLAGVEQVCCAIEESEIKKDRVFVVYCPDIHESIAGIIAGKVRERYNVPTFVLTNGEQGVKGSGRSIEEYNMFEELQKCKYLLEKFGGHPMAAGLSLPKENVDQLRRLINECSTLTDEDILPKIYIDARIPLDSIDLHLADELRILEPYGKGNPKPVFAEKEVSVSKAVDYGSKNNVLKLKLITRKGKYIDAVYFGDSDAFQEHIKNKFGEQECQKMYSGKPNRVLLDIVFNIDINQYNGYSNVQLVIQNYR